MPKFDEVLTAWNPFFNCQLALKELITADLMQKFWLNGYWLISNWAENWFQNSLIRVNENMSMWQILKTSMYKELWLKVGHFSPRTAGNTSPFFLYPCVYILEPHPVAWRLATGILQLIGKIIHYDYLLKGNLGWPMNCGLIIMQ